MRVVSPAPEGASGRNQAATAQRQVSAGRRRPSGPVIQTLERRVLLAVHLVISEADAGPGTLRQAILDSNASAGIRDTILFAIGPGVRTIRPNSGGAGPLPAITDPVDIDASPRVALPTQQIELSGEAAPAGSDGLTISGDVPTLSQ